MKNEHGNGSTKFNRKKVAPTDEETKRLSLIVSCEVCRKTFSSEINLKSHRKYAHTEDKAHSCNQCGVKFKEKKNLRVHLLTVHKINQMVEKYCEEETTTKFKCEICESEFMYKNNLMAHMRSKHEESSGSYGCNKCEARYKHMRTLADHMRTKHGNWVYLLNV